MYSLQWNKGGSQLAVTTKDQKMRIFHARNMGSHSDSMQMIAALEGQNHVKYLINKQKVNEKMMDLRDLSKPLIQIKCKMVHYIYQVRCFLLKS